MRTAGGAAAALEYVGAATTLWAATAARWAAASWCGVVRARRGVDAVALGERLAVVRRSVG